MVEPQNFHNITFDKNAKWSEKEQFQGFNDAVTKTISLLRHDIEDKEVQKKLKANVTYLCDRYVYTFELK